jgi:TatD DNase family protein
MSLVDTHCHLNFDRYDEDRQSVLERADDSGVKRIINPGTDIDSSRASIDLAGQYPGVVFAAVGVHPNSTADWSSETLAAIERLAVENRVVAIGEIGLDYYWDKSPPETQKVAFEQQLELANKLKLPVIIHNREASEDVLPTLEKWARELPDALRSRPGVLHSFSAEADYANRAIEAGFYLGFTGPITFKKAESLRQVAATVPLDRILVETDGPFLTPHPYRGKRNEPAYIPYIIERLAALHQVSDEEMARITTKNAERLFGL